MIKYLRLCYPCAMRLDIFYKYRLQRPNELLEHLQQRLILATEGIPDCHRPKDTQCWSTFMKKLSRIWEDHVIRLGEIDEPNSPLQIQGRGVL